MVCLMSTISITPANSLSRNLIPFEMLVFNVDDISEEGTILAEPSAEEDRGFRLPSPGQNQPSDES